MSARERLAERLAEEKAMMEMLKFALEANHIPYALFSPAWNDCASRAAALNYTLENSKDAEG